MPGGSQNCFAMDSCLQVLFQPLDIRELRDLTRTRKKLTEDRTRHKNRIHKTLQDANIKLSTVATDIFGVSGHAMIMALLEKDDLSLEEIKSMTKGKLMKKIGLLIKALDSKVTDHHRFLLKLHFEHIDSISSQIALLDEGIYQKLEIHNKEFELIRTVPGINAITGASIIAEIGVDMSRFPSEHHLASWAAMCPGNNESAGKRKSGRTQSLQQLSQNHAGGSSLGSFKDKRYLSRCKVPYYR